MRTASRPAASVGLDWAAFILGMPNEMVVDTNDTYALFSPYYSGFAQDTWRVNRNLTLTLGLRLEYERGATERYDRAIAYFDPNLELPISAAAEAAYARNPIPELPASAFDVRGGPVYAGVNGTPRELWKSELMWLPRVSAAWQLGPKAIVRGGYGVYYDTLNVMNSAIDQFGFSRATSTQLTNDAGTTWLAGDPRNGISPLVDPFPLRADGSRYDAPVRDALGSMARVGEGFTFGRYDRQHPRVQRWRAGIQRELGANMLVEASYWGQYADRLFVTTRLDALPEQYWNASNTRNNAIASNLNQQVPNPFYIGNFESLRTSDPALYRQMSTLSQFTSPTIAKNRLLRPFPHMNGLNDTAQNTGAARTHALELNFLRRFAQGFMVNASYTRMFQKNRTFLDNEYETVPTIWYPSDTARPHRVTATGLYELPFGQGPPLPAGRDRSITSSAAGRSPSPMSTSPGRCWPGATTSSIAATSAPSPTTPPPSTRRWSSGSIRRSRSSASPPTSPPRSRSVRSLVSSKACGPTA